jgi:hypothetical protein
MKGTNDIIKSALLGTDKFMPEPEPALLAIAEKIHAKRRDKEDAFLKIAATTLLYETLGSKPTTHSAAPLPVCPPEQQIITSHANVKLIQSFLVKEEDILLQYALYQCKKHQQILPSSLVPTLLNRALLQKKNAAAYLAVCGEAGRWLGSLNPHWQALYENTTTENVWETGDFNSRKAYLAEVRSNNPAAAIELLQTNIAQESAANRAAFLQTLHTNLSQSDEPFLQYFLQDKSGQVKQTALQLLRKIEGSAINQLYLNYLQQVVTIQEERQLLGSKKKKLLIKENITPSPELFNAGIEKVSVQKSVSDPLFWIAQVLAYLHPTSVARQLNIPEDDLPKLVLEYPQGTFLLPYLTQSVLTYRHRPWANRLLALEQVTDVRLLELADEAILEKQMEKWLGSNVTDLVNHLVQDDYRIIPNKIIEKLLDYLEKNPYQIQQNSYARLALQLPTSMLAWLETTANHLQNDYQAVYFKNSLLKMIQIINVRNSLQF